MKKLVPILFIIGGLALGFFGFQKLDDSTKGISIGKLEISAEDESQSGTAYAMLGLGAVLLVGGIITATRK